MAGRPLIVRVAEGSITKVKTLAIVLGHCQGMVPEGTERAVDVALDGAVSAFLEDRSIRGDLGDFFVIPALLGSLPAEIVVILGLGPVDLFTHKAVTEKESSSFLYQIAHRLIKGLLASNIIQFATVPIGAGGAGLPVRSVVREYVSGICQALLKLDRDRKINEFTIVEVDPDKIQDIHQGLTEASLDLQGQFVFDVRRVRLPETPQPAAGFPVQRTTVLVARRKGREFSYSVYNERPVQLMRAAQINDDSMGDLTGELMDYLRTGDGAHGLKATAQTFYEMMVPRQIRQVVREDAQRNAIILNLESPLALIPWELCYDRQEEVFLGELPLGRQIMGEESYRLSPRPADKQPGLDILILANLSGDLPHAETEGIELKRYIENLGLYRGSPLRVKLLTCHDLGNKPSKAQILKLVYQGTYEVLHYCGHAYYDTVDPYKSGWRIGPNPTDVIRAYEFCNLPQPPAFVFANACESAVLEERERSKEHEFAHSLAGAFIKAGVDLYLGSLVKISDTSARNFAIKFYNGLFGEGKSIGTALSQARTRLIRQEGLGNPIWANYVLYGSPVSRL